MSVFAVAVLGAAVDEQQLHTITAWPPAQQKQKVDCSNARSEEFLDWWLGPDIANPAPENQWWMTGNPKYDEEARRFEPLYDFLVSGAKCPWMDTPRGRLTQLLMLDQIAAMIFRGTAKMLATRDRAADLAWEAVKMGLPNRVPAQARLWYFMPFEHNEQMFYQEKSVAYLHMLAGEGCSKSETISFYPVSENPCRFQEYARCMCSTSMPILASDGFSRSFSASLVRAPRRCGSAL